MLESQLCHLPDSCVTSGGLLYPSESQMPHLHNSRRGRAVRRAGEEALLFKPCGVMNVLFKEGLQGDKEKKGEKTETETEPSPQACPTPSG